LTETEQHLTKTEQPLTETEQNLIKSEQNLTLSEQHLTLFEQLDKKFPIILKTEQKQCKLEQQCPKKFKIFQNIQN
jgi:hypothetical protein